MDRMMIYPGAIPLETDLLNTNKFAMTGLAKACAALFGSTTMVNGLSVVQTVVASLNVLVNPGEIYSLQNIDSTAYSSLASDTTHQIVKQGISLDQVQLSCPAPGTAGFSINYLVQATFAEVDGTPVVLPYYNASNPSVAYSGPANAGTTNNTTRKGTITLSAKAGSAATTGTQTTPAPDAGYVGLYVVTVANGQSTITAGNIVQYVGAPLLSPAGLIPGGIQGNYHCISAAGGTADAITGTYSPNITTLTNGMTLYVRASSANATSTPNFTPNSGVIAAKTIVKGNGIALTAGDIAGAGHWLELQYDILLDRWFLQNPIINRGSASGVLTSSTSQTLLPSDAGKWVFPLASSLTFTLPLLSLVPPGTVINFNGNAYGATVVRQGTDPIIMAAATGLSSISVAAYDTATFIQAFGNWYVIAGSLLDANSTSLGFGITQTWQAVTRTSGTTYYNTTGRPITVKADAQATGSVELTVAISVNGSSAGNLVHANTLSGTTISTGSIVIPTGGSYVLTDTNVSSRNTHELR